MPIIRFALRNLWRDLKSGESFVLLAALTVAVISLTAVGFFTDRVAQAVHRQASEVLAGDLRLESARALSEAYFREAARAGLRSARIVSFPTAVFSGDASQLASVHAVSAGYPLRGTVRVASTPFGAASPTQAIPAPGQTWVDARLLMTLGSEVGRTVNLGASSLRVTAILDYRPDQGSGFVGLAPAILINEQDLAATQLIQPGSRAEYVGIFAGGVAQVAAFRGWLTDHKADRERLLEIGDSSRQLNSAIDRAVRFLSLASLASVLLAAVAVAMGARRYMRLHIDTVALMKCIGASQGFVLRIALVELALLGLTAVAVGSLLGYGAETGLALLAKDLIQIDLPQPSVRPVWAALATVMAMLFGFALPPLLRLKNTPPARVLRKTITAPPLRSGIPYLFAILALAVILWTLVADLELVLGLLLGVFALGLALAVVGWALVRVTRQFRGGVGVAWRYGLANVSRRGRDSIVQVVAFGLGLMALLLLAVLRGSLIDDWRASLPKDSPNQFLINIAPADRQALQSYLRAHGIAPPPLFPMVRARLVSINGRAVSELKFAKDRGRAFAEREQNLTWSEQLPQDNRLTAGNWWSATDRGQPLVSLSQEYADDLQLQLGDRLNFDIAGEALAVRVASVRKVRWDSFRPNFFLVFPPGLIDGAAGTYLTSVYLPAGERKVLADLVRHFPSVSVIDIDTILAQVRAVMDKASLAVQYVFLFTLLAGVVVLLAAVQSTRDERRYESAMLRTLGASRLTVLQGVAAEFGALGFLSGALGACGASIAGWIMAVRLFSLNFHFDPWLWIIGLVCGTALVGVAGTLATRGVVNTPPIEVLRQGSGA